MSFFIKYYNRYSKKLEEEKVYGGDWVRFFNSNSFGRKLENLISKPFVSVAYGVLQSSPITRKKVKPFIENFQIDMSLYQGGSRKSSQKEESYDSFNEFFIRQFKEGKRSFVQGSEMPAFAEGRYIGHESVSLSEEFPVKGKFLSAQKLLQKRKWFSTFENGPLLIARLCPVDYHRYHYPDDGVTVDHYLLRGAYHSVNPIALKFRPSLFTENVRRVSILETKSFGKLAYIEVGATCVGRIVQSFDERNPFIRGDEKGYFLFGGSTVILLGEKGRWIPCEDIIEQTRAKKEVYIHLGDRVATS